jgi:hypothetical protein
VASLEQVAELTADEEVLGALSDEVDHDRRVDLLADAAEGRVGSKLPAALLGALLVIRTGRALESHVERMLENFARPAPDGDLRLIDVYLRAGFLHMVDVGGTPSEVLARALDVEEAALGRVVEVPLRDELAWSFEQGSRAYRIRHQAIAEAARRVCLARLDLNQDLTAAGREIVRAAVALHPDGWQNEPWSKVFYLSRRAIGLSDQLRVGTAEGAAFGAPTNPFLATTLAATYREHEPDDGGARGAAHLLGFMHQLQRDGATNEHRALVQELAVCLGARGDGVSHAAASVAVSLLALSDGLPVPLTRQTVHVSIGEIGQSTLDLIAHERDDLAGDALQAVAWITNATQNRFRQLYANATRGGTIEIDDADQAIESLARLFRACEPSIPEDARDVLAPDIASFGLEALRLDLDS